MSFTSRLSHAWNAFLGRDPTKVEYQDLGPSTYYRPDTTRLTGGNDRSIVNSIFNRISVDVAQRKIRHVDVDENGKYLKEHDSDLNNCLSVSANIDQTGRAFIQDAVLTMLDQGVVALVPTDTNFNPDISSFDVETIRAGRIIEWYPKNIRVSLYNENKGYREEILVPKNTCAIVQNPLYSIMNDRNSILQRLIRKLNILDAIDEQSGSGKLDLLIQLPYIVKSDARREQAEDRRKKIEEQLEGSKLGIAYIDGTEKVTQLNRPLENNIMSQVEYLTSMLYSQLGITSSVFDGTADEATMLNYINRTIEPILSAFTDEMTRKFLTKTARTRGQTIMFFDEPFRLTTVENIAKIADTFTRNEIMSSNEIRSLLGFRPVNDPRADELRNKNLNITEGQEAPMTTDPNGEEEEEEPKSQLELLRPDEVGQ